jgi:hypothetical protein
MNESESDSPNDERFESQGLDDKLRQRLEGLIPEVIRRTFYAGLGAVFTTEEGIRKLANEISMPKDVANFLIQQAQGTKNELFRIVAAEIRAFLESLHLNEELQRLLTSLSFEIKTEIRFIPNEAKLVKPKIKNKISVRRKAKEVDALEEEIDELDQEEPIDEADGGEAPDEPVEGL